MAIPAVTTLAADRHAAAEDPERRGSTAEPRAGPPEARPAQSPMPFWHLDVGGGADLRYLDPAVAHMLGPQALVTVTAVYKPFYGSFGASFFSVSEISDPSNLPGKDGMMGWGGQGSAGLWLRRNWFGWNIGARLNLAKDHGGLYPNPIADRMVPSTEWSAGPEMGIRAYGHRDLALSLSAAYRRIFASMGLPGEGQEGSDNFGPTGDDFSLTLTLEIPLNADTQFPPVTMEHKHREERREKKAHPDEPKKSKDHKPLLEEEIPEDEFIEDLEDVEDLDEDVIEEEVIEDSAKRKKKKERKSQPRQVQDRVPLPEEDMLDGLEDFEDPAEDLAADTATGHRRIGTAEEDTDTTDLKPKPLQPWQQAVLDLRKQAGMLQPIAIGTNLLPEGTPALLETDPFYQKIASDVRLLAVTLCVEEEKLTPGQLDSIHSILARDLDSRTSFEAYARILILHFNYVLPQPKDANYDSRAAGHLSQISQYLEGTP